MLKRLIIVLLFLIIFFGCLLDGDDGKDGM